MSGSQGASQQVGDADLVSGARRAVAQRAKELGHPELADDAALVTSELVTNALLHGGGCTGFEVNATVDGIRIEVRDDSRVPPLLGNPTEEALTGRGLRLVASLSARWGADSRSPGKIVWAEIGGPSPGTSLNENDLLALWDDDGWDVAVESERRFHVELGDVPTDLLLSAKAHVENVVREFTLASVGAQIGVTADVPEHLRTLLAAVVDRFSEPRQAIKRQAIEAARRGDVRTRLALDLPASMADAAEEYIQALDEVDTYCRARRLLTLETPPQHQVFRRWYIEALVSELRAAAAGLPAPTPPTFEARLLAEFERVTSARKSAERVARLYSVAAALATAATPEAVAEAVLNEGVAALGASGGGILLATEHDQLLLPAAVGYDEAVVEKLRSESRGAELPAAVALRTGEKVWLESRHERDEQFPELVGLEASTVALCAVPLEVQGRRLGAIRFSFNNARLFDDEERRFVLALAAQTAQALDRAQLQRARIEVSRRLQRSLLPPTLPTIPNVEVAAIYHPFGTGIDVGGDFYDIWPVGPDRWAIAIGDASGTGPDAAALTALVRHTLRALTISEADPAAVLRTLNTAMLDAASDETDERFCTAIFGIVTAAEGIEVCLGSGGHPSPMVRRADGTIDTIPIGGTLLGTFVDPDMRTIRLQLGPGDTLVVVTDGVLEARNGGGFFDASGLEGVLSGNLSSAGATAEAIERAVLDHTGGSLNDDMAAVVLHVPNGS